MGLFHEQNILVLIILELNFDTHDPNYLHNVLKSFWIVAHFNNTFIYFLGTNMHLIIISPDEMKLNIVIKKLLMTPTVHFFSICVP